MRREMCRETMRKDDEAATATHRLVGGIVEGVFVPVAGVNL